MGVQHTCIVCGGASGRRHFCWPCGAMHLREQAAAIGKVAHAVRRGQIKPASAFACMDCGKPAAMYDHRDYTKPLDVQPVCAWHNKLRGHALNSVTAGTRPIAEGC